MDLSCLEANPKIFSFLSALSSPILRPLLCLRDLEEALPLEGIADLSHGTEQGLDTRFFRPRLNDKLHHRHQAFPLKRNVFMLRFLLCLQYLSTYPSRYLSYLYFNQSITLAAGSSTSSLTFPTACIPWSMAPADSHSGYEIMRYLHRAARDFILIHPPSTIDGCTIYPLTLLTPAPSIPKALNGKTVDVNS